MNIDKELLKRTYDSLVNLTSIIEDEQILEIDDSYDDDYETANEVIDELYNVLYGKGSNYETKK